MKPLSSLLAAQADPRSCILKDQFEYDNERG